MLKNLKNTGKLIGRNFCQSLATVIFSLSLKRSNYEFGLAGGKIWWYCIKMFGIWWRNCGFLSGMHHPEMVMRWQERLIWNWYHLCAVLVKHSVQPGELKNCLHWQVFSSFFCLNILLAVDCGEILCWIIFWNYLVLILMGKIWGNYICCWLLHGGTKYFF